MDLKEDRLNSLNSIFFKSRNNDMEFVRVTIADRFVVGLLHRILIIIYKILGGNKTKPKEKYLNNVCVLYILR